MRLIQPSDDPRVVGDEPLLLSRRTAVPVAIGGDRPAAAQLLVGAGCDVIVSDDGLQHYALARDCEVVVIDGDRRFGNGWLLPAGPLRETRSRLAVADAIVVNGGRALLEGALSMRLEARSAVALTGGRVSPLDAFAGVAVHAVAGIGNPERFFNMLRAYGILVEGHALADHARIAREGPALRRRSARSHDRKGCRKMRSGGGRAALVRSRERVLRWRTNRIHCSNVILHRIASRESPRRGT